MVKRVQLKIQDLKRKTAAVRWTVGGLAQEGARRFRAIHLDFGHGTRDARDEATYLTLHALGLPLDATAVILDRAVSSSEARRVLNLFERRIVSGKPAAYLTREAWLGEFRFYVDERVIVPRSHIAGMLLNRLDPWIANAGQIRTALDLCTGSGCLAILLRTRLPVREDRCCRPVTRGAGRRPDQCQSVPDARSHPSDQVRSVLRVRRKTI